MIKLSYHHATEKKKSLLFHVKHADQFGKGIKLFDKFKPVKVDMNLKDDFYRAIQKYYLENNYYQFSSTTSFFNNHARIKRVKD